MAGDTSLERQQELLAGATPEQLAFWHWQLSWLKTARPDQLPPDDVDWTEFGVQAGRGYGKRLCVDTPIPTPSGWVRMGDLEVGGHVFDETGEPCKVLAVYDGLPETAWRLHFSDGSTLDADGEHQWVTWTHRERKQYLRNYPGRGMPTNWPTWRQPLMNNHGEVVGEIGPQVRTTAQIVETLKINARRDTNHCIPVCGDLRYPEADLPLDPWLLGYWLGNGSKRDGMVSCHHDDTALVRARFEAEGFAVTPLKSVPRDFYVKQLALPLRALGLLNNKHVPGAYLQAGVEQRRALLAGLLDSDGHCTLRAGHIEFCSTDRVLADGVVELARSLGQKPVIGTGRAMLNGKDRGEKYRVKWRSTYQPFVLPRKAAAWREPGSQKMRNQHRMIVRAERIEPKPMRCITVGSPNSLFLAGEAMIPTHNTRVGCEWLGRTAWEGPDGGNYASIGPTQRDVRFVIFEGESGLLNIIPPELIEQYASSDLYIRLKNGATIYGYSAEKADRLRGPQHNALHCDEVAAWGPTAQDTWDMAMFGLRLGDRPRVLWTSTPRPTAFVRYLTAPKPNRIVIRGSTYDNKANLPQSFFDQVAQYEGTRLGRQELYGELIDPEEAGIIKRSWMRLWPAKKNLPVFDWIIMSLDTAYTEKALDSKGDPDPTACGVFGVFRHKDGKGKVSTNIMVLDCWEDWLGLPALMKRVKKEMRARYGGDEERPLFTPMHGGSMLATSGHGIDILLIEDKGSGISLRQMLMENGIEAYAYNPGRADKLSRLHIVSPLFAQRRVWLPESDNNPGKPRNWCEPMIAQLCAFSGDGSVKHDDFVDVVTQSLRMCMDRGLVSLAIDKVEERERASREMLDAPREEVQNPYSL